MNTQSTLLKTEQKLYMFNLKDIAKEIRQRLKKEFPKCKFSITIDRYSGGQSMSINLMSANFAAFNDDKDHAQINHYSIGNSDLTDQAKTVMQRAYDMSGEYNYNNSDSSVDYFDVNFYTHLNVGK